MTRQPSDTKQQLALFDTTRACSVDLSVTASNGKNWKISRVPQIERMDFLSDFQVQHKANNTYIALRLS
jgi:hypothetical protein